jgi:hypothetical protein
VEQQVQQLQTALSEAQAELGASRQLLTELQKQQPEAAAVVQAAVKKEQVAQEV